MKVEDIMDLARESLGSRRVFGEPYEKNGVTVIPAARVMGGAGGGGAGERSAGAGAEGAEGISANAGNGNGMGYGMVGSPAGAFVIKGNDVTWMPAVDVNRILLGFQVVLIVFLLAVRSVAKARAANARFQSD